MYHYVRDLDRTRYPAIKGCQLSRFRHQLDYIAKHHTVVTVQQVVAALKNNEALPNNSVWLTFDDGFSDHYGSVFPLLYDRGWQGSFFPPARAVRDRDLLDVHRIHFILAVQQEPKVIIGEIRSFIDAQQGDYSMRPFDQYWQDYASPPPSSLDGAEVYFIKQMLQYALPEEPRGNLTKTLFDRCVSIDSATFANELYMTPEQLRTMVRCGMYVGSHGDTHRRLNLLDPSCQAIEIERSLAFLSALGAATHDWIMCYPYGEHNESLLPLLRQRGCAVGLTTEPACANLGIDDPLQLPRLDTNNFPATCPKHD
jgi:peptidoglycan/xylan/chitin deacetylase (PgdA/CDA1 family)